MASDARTYLRTVLSLWITFCAIAWYYTVTQHLPIFISVAFLLALLLETALYLAPGFSAPRDAFESLGPPPLRALLLAASAAAPYLIYSLVSGTFHWRWFGLLGLLVSIASSWFVAQPKRAPLVDILFLAFMAGVFLTRVFGRIYIDLSPRIPADVLGQLMWIRVGVVAVLSFRKLGGIGFGFIPSPRDWKIGVQNFLAFLPVGIVLGLWLRFAQPRPLSGPWWKVVAVALGTFCAFLWVVALSEEFFFRGVLQQALAKITHNRWSGLLLASVVFGLVHLPFRHFPNWQFAILAFAAGVFYGIAYMRARSIRAAMVTHALVVTTWRVFFS